MTSAGSSCAEDFLNRRLASNKSSFWWGKSHWRALQKHFRPPIARFICLSHTAHASIMAFKTSLMHYFLKTVHNWRVGITEITSCWHHSNTTAIPPPFHISSMPSTVAQRWPWSILCIKFQSPTIPMHGNCPSNIYCTGPSNWQWKIAERRNVQLA